MGFGTKNKKPQLEFLNKNFMLSIMKRHLIIVYAIILASCQQKDIVKVNDSSVKLIELQIDKIIDEISVFKSQIIYTQDTTDLESLKQLKKAFIIIQDENLKGLNNDSTIKQIKDIYNEFGNKYYFNISDLNNDIDSLNCSSDKRLTIAINELCLFSRISNAFMKNYLMFNRWRIETIKTSKNEYDIYLIPKLDSNNSFLSFGYMDENLHKLVTESDSNIIVSLVTTHK